MTRDVAVVGGGLVGLATALAVLRRHPGARVLVAEKEARLAAHQSGRNSGVIHSGIYYRPGSLKARFARAGAESMVAFCAEHGLPHEVCGKLIVAVEERELGALERLYRRGLANGLAVERLDRAAVAEREPHVRALAGIFVQSTGIVDYGRVAARYGELAVERGCELLLGALVERIARRRRTVVLETTAGELEARLLVNCAGLHSDRVARLAGVDPGCRIVPFRGEYYDLRPEARGLVRTLVYPVPNPDYPFLGVHLTRTLGGGVHAGPNAVLALAREGYRKRDVRVRDAAETLAYPGFWRLARRSAGEGLRELARSLSARAFARSLQRLVPELGAGDLVPAPAGVRAQALMRDGSLVDDFLIVEDERSVHVCNAPSPGATSSLEIGRAVAERVAARLGLPAEAGALA